MAVTVAVAEPTRTFVNGTAGGTIHESLAPIAPVAEVHARHSVAGVNQPRQGITQTVPEPLVLCLSCGWMRSHEYAEHLTEQVAQVVREHTADAVAAALARVERLAKEAESRSNMSLSRTFDGAPFPAVVYVDDLRAALD